MDAILLTAVAALAFANGANDNFKGVATLWGAQRASYGHALAWATGFTLLGSLAAVWFARGLAARFNGSSLIPEDVYTRASLLVAVSLGAAVIVLLATRIGLPVSTTHALTGALLGAGVVAAGWPNSKLLSLAGGILLPLLLAPMLGLSLTIGTFPIVARFARKRDCICVEEKRAVAVIPSGAALTAATSLALPSLRWASSAECEIHAPARRWSVSGTALWLSGAAISFARGLNDTPKIAALLWLLPASAIQSDYLLVGLAMAGGGILGARRVARTLAREVTPMEPSEATAANLVAGSLVTLASVFALPVSTTHVTSGSIFGIGLLRRREANWKRVREILLAWVVTLPAGALLGAACYTLFAR